MDRRLFAAACCTCCLIAVPAFAAKALKDIPLEWSPRTSLAALGPLDVSGRLLTLKLRVEPFVDTRQNPALIAENREHGGVRPVTTSSDVARFFTEHLRGALDAAGLRMVDDAADFTVSGEIKQFFVTETDEYRGELSLIVHVKNAAGTEVWSGAVSGAAKNFGRSYRADNYYVTISDMILHASFNLLATPSFREALQQR